MIVNTTAKAGWLVSLQAMMLATAKIWHTTSKAVYFLKPFRRLNRVTAVVHVPVANANIAV